MMNKYMNFSKTRLKVKHDMRGTYSLLWTFRGARNDGLLGAAERVKEDLTEIGIFVLVHLPFEHIEKKVGKSTVITNNNKRYISSVSGNRNGPCPRCFI